jgi:hypothetical protein
MEIYQYFSRIILSTLIDGLDSKKVFGGPASPECLIMHIGLAHSGGNDRFCARLKTDISALHFWKEVAETNLKW